MSNEVNWEKYNATQLSFGNGTGARVVCQICGTRQRVRLQRGCKVSETECIECGKATLKKAIIDNQGNLVNDPSIDEKRKEA